MVRRGRAAPQTSEPRPLASSKYRLRQPVGGAARDVRKARGGGVGGGRRDGVGSWIVQVNWGGKGTGTDFWRTAASKRANESAATR